MTKPDQRMHVAMIGCGGYASYLIDRLKELPELCRLVAVTSRNPESEPAKNCARRGIKVYANAEALFEGVAPEECPAVIIPTSIDSHLDYTRQAIAKGFHVLLEKPPAATVQDTQQLIDLQRSSGKWIGVNFQHLYNTATQSIKQRLMAGEFGAVKAVRACALWTRPESYFSRSGWSGCLQVNDRWVLDGTIGNPLAHLLAEALYLASCRPGMAEPQTVTAELYRANDIASEDTSCLRTVTGDGVPVFFCASLCSDVQTPVICEVETEQAVIRLEDYFWLTVCWKDGREEPAETGELDHHLDRRIMLQSMIQSLSRGERPLVTVEECLPFMKAWNGAFESCGLPTSIGKNDLDVKEEGGEKTRLIRGLDALCKSAFTDGKLFSELGTEWSAEALEIDLAEYDRFPSIHPEMIGLLQAEDAVLN